MDILLQKRIDEMTPEYQLELHELIYYMDSYISFGNNADLAVIDSDSGQVVYRHGDNKKEPK